jgi:hypothetical protein
LLYQAELPRLVNQCQIAFGFWHSLMTNTCLGTY